MRKFKPLPSKKILNELFRYEDGFLYWRESKKNRTIGKIGQYPQRSNVGINGLSYPVSRVIFKMHKGYDPEYCDHKDEDPSNNKIGNLQSLTNGENIRKSRAYIKLHNIPKKKYGNSLYELEQLTVKISYSVKAQAKIQAKNERVPLNKYVEKVLQNDFKNGISMAASLDLLKACKMAKIEIENGRADQVTVAVLEDAINKALSSSFKA